MSVQKFPIYDLSEGDTTFEFNHGRNPKTSFQVVAKDVDDSDMVIKLQQSNDKKNWNNISGAEITVDSGDSTNMISTTVMTAEFGRLVVTVNSVAVGTLEPNVNEKS